MCRLLFQMRRAPEKNKTPPLFSTSKNNCFRENSRLRIQGKMKTDSVWFFPDVFLEFSFPNQSKFMKICGILQGRNFGSGSKSLFCACIYSKVEVSLNLK